MPAAPLRFLLTLSHCCLLAPAVFGEQPGSIALATHNGTQPLSTAHQAETTARIRKIVLNQGDDARALANLVQLTRELPPLTTSQLYLDLANDYLRLGEYNQAANVLQQHVTQYPDQPHSTLALVTLMRLYSSSEVSHTQQAKSASADAHQAFLKYANFFGDQTVHQNSALRGDPALTFQRSVTTRLSGRAKAAQGRLTQLRHQAGGGIWHTRARAEHWLQGDRTDEPPLPVTICRRTNERPHLDGDLTDALWLREVPVQFAYDEEFLYLAVTCAKKADQAYATHTSTRTYDADLSKQDHVQLSIDLDRDYATSFELAIDHRGWTNDRCWLDASWNPQWFVAAGGDDAQWIVEAAIPIKALQAGSRQRAGEAWAVRWQRVWSASSPAEAGSPGEAFHLLVFE